MTSQLWITNKILEKYGVKALTLEEFRNNWKQPYMEFYKKYLSKDFSEEEQSRLYKEALFHAECPKSQSFPEVVEIIKKCKGNGYFLAVVSSDLKESLEPEIIEFGLEGVFNEVYADQSNKLEAVKSLIRNNDLDLQKTYFVGDSNHEIDVS